MKIIMAEGVYPITFTLDLCKVIGLAMQEIPDEHRRRAITKLCNSGHSLRGCEMTAQETSMIYAFIEGWCETEVEVLTTTKAIT